MPRTKGSATTASVIRQVQRHAGAVLARLRKDIRVKELELVTLKRHEEALRQLAGGGAREAGGGAREAGGGARGARAAGAGGRINWRNVLVQLPKQFKASSVRQVRGLKDKRPSEVFAAITRWIDAGLAKRKSRGLYENV
jgi:hypothetical protein